MSACYLVAHSVLTSQSIWGPGGWTLYRPLIAEDEQIFAEVMKSQPGGHYWPQAVAYQVLAGKNYRFRCLTGLPDAAGTSEVEVEIAWPLGCLPHLVGIKRVR